MNKLSNVLDLKINNRYRILECLRKSMLSRADIARITGLTKAAVTTLTTEMIETNLITEAGLKDKNSLPGRTSMLLKINPKYAYAVGVTLHRKHIGVCLVDILGNEICGNICNTAAFNTENQAIDWIINEILIQQKNKRIGKCIGIGISSPGPLNYKSGIIFEPPGLPIFNNYPIAEIIQNKTGLPVFLENNSVALALFEHYKFNNDFKNKLFTVISDGIGGAVINDGTVVRGSGGFSGEIGHISIDINGKPCPCGNKGCLEMYATLSNLKKDFNFNDYKQIADDAENNNKEALNIINSLTKYLGNAFINAVNLFDLDAIIIYGEYSYKCKFLYSKIEEYINKNSIIAKAHKIKVVNSSLQENSLYSASAISAINNFYYSNNI